MRTWQRAPRDLLCGGCGPITTIQKGSPVLLIQIPGVKAVKYRGPCCAGEPPPDLPPLVEPDHAALASWTRVGQAGPARTHGALKTFAARTPYRDEP